MVKLGKKKLAVSEENAKNGAGNSGDDESDINKEVNNKNESNSKKRRSSAVGTTTKSSSSESDESDDWPLNGSKSSAASGAPPKSKKQKTQKTPKAKGKAALLSTAASSKNDNNKKTSSKSIDTEPEEDDDDDDNNEETEFEVEAIVGHKTKRGESFFLVRWKGYGKDDDSWEPEAELNCDDLIAEYRKAGSKNKAVNKKSPSSAKGVRGRKPNNKKVESDPEKEWAVERIIDYVDDDEQGGLYRIRWKGFGAKEDTWEPESNLSCEGLIEKFKKGLDQQRNVDVKHLRESPKKAKRLVDETIPRSNFNNRIERTSKRSAAKNRVFYGEE